MKLDNINDYIIDFSLAINIGKSKLIEYGIFPIKEFGIYILVAIINEQIERLNTMTKQDTTTFETTIISNTRAIVRFRELSKQGEFKEDILSLDIEPHPSNSEALLIPVMKEGILITELPDLNNIQQYYSENIEKLPNNFKDLEENHIFKVRISKKLSELTNSLTEKFT